MIEKERPPIRSPFVDDRRRRGFHVHGGATRGIGKDHQPRSPRLCPSASRAFALAISYYTIAACLPNCACPSRDARVSRAHPRHRSIVSFFPRYPNRTISFSLPSIIFYPSKIDLDSISIVLKQGNTCSSFFSFFFSFENKWRMF